MSRYLIRRSNDVQLRRQISDALNELSLGIAGETEIADGNDYTIVSGGQMRVWDKLTLTSGSLTIDGTLVIL